MFGQTTGGPGSLIDIAVTSALSAATVACGGGILCVVALTTTYTLLTGPDQKLKAKAA